MLARSHCAVWLPVLPGCRKWSSAKRYDHSRDPASNSAPTQTQTPTPTPIPTLTLIPTSPTPTSSPGAQDAELVDFFRIGERAIGEIRYLRATSFGLENQSRADTDCDCDTDSDTDSEGVPEHAAAARASS